MMLWAMLFVTCAFAQHKIDLNDFDKNGLLLKHINQTHVAKGDRENKNVAVFKAMAGEQPWPPKLQTNCVISQNDQVWVVVHRVCEICHDMFSTTDPELRSRCVSKCFSTDDFTRCVKLFKKKAS